MHFILQMELHSGRSASAAARRLCRFGREALLRVGLDPKRAPLLVALNLLRMIFLYGEARCVAQAKDGDRRYIRLLQAVVERFCRVAAHAAASRIRYYSLRAGRAEAGCQRKRIVEPKNPSGPQPSPTT